MKKKAANRSGQSWKGRLGTSGGDDGVRNLTNGVIESSSGYIQGVIMARHNDKWAVLDGSRGRVGFDGTADAELRNNVLLRSSLA